MGGGLCRGVGGFVGGEGGVDGVDIKLFFLLDDGWDGYRLAFLVGIER